MTAAGAATLPDLHLFGIPDRGSLAILRFLFLFFHTNMVLLIFLLLFDGLAILSSYPLLFRSFILIGKGRTGLWPAWMMVLDERGWR
jgi:hypothetical protein